jgi:hypothetical protein
MKHLCARLLVIAVLGGLLASAGCVVDNSDLVITDKVCVNIDEVQTDGEFSTFVVVDDFKAALDKKLAQYGKTPKDVKSIHMVSGTFKTVKVENHDWTVSAVVNIARQDDPNGAYTDGPAPLVEFTNQSLAGLKGQPADLDAAGVQVVNGALEALLNGDEPRLVMIVENESVNPSPTSGDPMAFTTTACVQFQIVITGGSNAGGKNR